ncbi:MAG: hypothetical protein HC872_06450 [Gammaproteobacteria bacterium]|nr:hypothetical protein [Gammaproteobacteria bacterium]
MTVSGFMDQTGAGQQWRGTWGGTLTRLETWQGVLISTRGGQQWRLRTAQGFSTSVPAGTYNILLNGFSAATGVSLTATYQ